jgi:cellulose biosynthesis protein BcsQ
LNESGADSEYDYIIFDCPPATKLVSQNAIAASESYVLPVIPDRISTRGVTHFQHLVGERIDKRLQALAAMRPVGSLPPAFSPITRIAGIVISMAQTSGAAHSGFVNEHTSQMNNLRRTWGNHVLTNVIERGVGVAESIGRGWPVFNQGWNVNVSTRGFRAMFRAVCDELEGRL